MRCIVDFTPRLQLVFLMLRRLPLSVRLGVLMIDCGSDWLAEILMRSLVGDLIVHGRAMMVSRGYPLIRIGAGVHAVRSAETGAAIDDGVVNEGAVHIGVVDHGAIHVKDCRVVAEKAT